MKQNMKTKFRILLNSITFSAALAIPLGLIAQERQARVAGKLVTGKDTSPSARATGLTSLPLEARASISAQLAKLTASGGAAFDYLGYSVAIDGDTVVVGAPLATIGTNHMQGAAYVFVKPRSGWSNLTEVAKLTASDGAVVSVLGLSVSISGDTVVAGATGASRPHCPQCEQGAVYVFVKPATGWADMTETAKLTASDAVAFDALGYSVAISGNTVVAGEVGDIFDGLGDRAAAYVFVEPVTGWINTTQTAKLTASDHLASDAFGISVAISGNTIVAGAPDVTTAGFSQLQGAAYVFVKPPSGWTDMTQAAKLTASHGTYADYLGTSVSISGDTVVAGAPGRGVSQGAAFVFVQPASGWADMTETAELTGGTFGDLLGYSVAISGNALAAGAPRWPAYHGPGSVYLFLKPKTGWRSTSHFNAKLTASDGRVNDYNGFSVGLSASTVVGGAHGATIGSNSQQGAAYVFAPGNSYLSAHTKLAAPSSSSTNFEPETKKQPRYRVISFGTFGGPQSYLNLNGPTSQVVNNNGIVAGFADTFTADPFCYIDDCFYPNAFQRRNDVLTNLGALPNGQWSAASWITDTGLIAGVSENGVIDPLISLPEFHAVLWKKGQIIDIGTLPGGFESLVPVVNNRGQVVGLVTNGTSDPYSFLYNLIFGITTGTQTRAFLWDEQNGMQDLGTLGGPDAWATAVNERGQIAGHSYTSYSAGPGGIPQIDPFFWENGKMTDLGTLGGPTGFANSLNGQGQVVGQMDTAKLSVGIFIFHPYLWDKGTLTDLGTFYPPLGHGAANWINDSGEVVGWADDRLSDFPFLWKDGLKHNLGTVAGDFSAYANHINSKRQIVGSSHSIAGSAHAFLWEDGGPIIDLNTVIASGSGVRLTNALFINERGEIAATGFLPNGDQRAFLLIPCGEGDENCEDNIASQGAATQGSPMSVTQHLLTRTSVSPAIGGRGVLDRLRCRRFPGLRPLEPATNR
jgi:probable HAF family extracellular repeat protein